MGINLNATWFVWTYNGRVRIMKKTVIILLVLLLAAGTTFAGDGGNGGFGATKDNPKQPGKSSIYFYDVESDDNGYGKLVINMDKKTFVFNGQNFTPGQNIHLQVDAGSEFYLIAKGKSTKSGNLHIEGQWKGGLPPTPGSVGAVCGYQPAYGFRLVNLGGYVARMRVQWSDDNGVTWHNSSGETKDVSLLETYDVNIKTLDPTIPIGSQVRIKMIVVWGDDVVADEWFTYVDEEMLCYPRYFASGAVWNASLEFEDNDCTLSDGTSCVYCTGCSL